ncbi:MAG: SDR family NAD(P)-dependent oxidoreductase [Prolixibacteraceae bacterium]
MKPIAIVTGATSGIGYATAKILASNNYNVIITGRRTELLHELEENLIKSTSAEVYSLNFDIREKDQVEEAFNSLPEDWRNIALLINNAGLSVGLEPLNEGSIADWDQMIDTNIKGLLYVTKLVSNWMIPMKSGHIINISSIAGKEAYANGSVYCATKFAVEAITKSMRLDFLKHNIKVGSISPGMVETEFSIVRFHGDEKRAANVYKGMTPLYAEDIAETILFMATRPAHVNIDDVLIMPSAQGFTRDVIRNE